MAQSPDEVTDVVTRAAETPARSINAAPTTDELRSRIEETRAEMSDTIDAIQTRLSPKRVLADAKESVTEATTATVKRLADGMHDASGSALRRVQTNPIPTAVAASAAAAVLARVLWGAARRRQVSRSHTSDSGMTGARACSCRNARLLALVTAGTACWLFSRARGTAAPPAAEIARTRP